MTSAPIAFDWDGGTVSGARHGDPSGTWVVLTHGAAGNMETPQLRAVCDGLAERGLTAVRFNLPYAEAGKRSPGPQARDEACWRAVAGSAAKEADRVIVGGRSYGGRMASHAVADGAPAAGVVFLAYPLHPPGKPDRLRRDHLLKIAVPMLFLQGTRDPFAQPDLLAETIGMLPSATLHAVDGGDHSHKVSGRPAADVTAELVAATADWISALG